MSARRLVLVAGLVGSLSGCAQTRYNWGDYEGRLHAYYADPGERQRFEDELLEIIVESGESGKPIPPGICAEYGFALHENGRSEEAIAYFEKEKALWPESRVLMDRLIGRVRIPAAPIDAAGKSADSIEPVVDAPVSESEADE